MALPATLVKFGAALTTLNDVLRIDYTFGRRWITDPYGAGSLTVECRNVSSWTTAPKVGNKIGVGTFNGGPFDYYFWGGRISDVKIVYGEVPSLDTAIITAEGTLARIGRKQLNAEVFAQTDSGTYAANIGTAAGIAPGSTYTGGSIISAQTFTGSALDILNEVTLTEMGRLIEGFDGGSGNPYWSFFPRNQLFVGMDFSDVPADWAADYQTYTAIDFKSAAEAYSNQVTITPAGLTVQQSSTGAAPWYGLQQDSVDYSNTQAKSHADYLLGRLSSTTAYPTSISGQYTALKTATAQYNFLLNIYQETIGSIFTLKFRGATYNLITEGGTVSMTPDDIRATWYLSSQDQASYLKWGSGNFYNRWDYNKWGF